MSLFDWSRDASAISVGDWDHQMSCEGNIGDAEVICWFEASWDYLFYWKSYFLKVSPTKWNVRFDKMCKLNRRFVSPFEVLWRVVILLMSWPFRRSCLMFIRCSMSPFWRSTCQVTHARPRMRSWSFSQIYLSQRLLIEFSIHLVKVLWARHNVDICWFVLLVCLVADFL